MSRNINIAYVAEACGVSRTTISRYLNGKYEYMSKDTRNRIEKVIEELGYRPNLFARSLKTKKSGLIGIVVHDIANPFSATMAKGTIDRSLADGYQPLVVSTNGNPELERKYINSMLESRVEGLIITTTGANNDFLKKLNTSETPVVLANSTIVGNEFDTVSLDIERTTVESIEKLFDEGFEVVAYFTQDISTMSTRIRQVDTYKEVVRERSEEEPIVCTLTDKASETETLLREFVNKYRNKKKAIFACGVTLIWILQAAKKLNMRIPRDFGIIGFDDFGWGELIGEDGISVIRNNVYDMGKISADILLNRMSGKYEGTLPFYVEMKSKIVYRGSTQLKV